MYLGSSKIIKQTYWKVPITAVDVKQRTAENKGMKNARASALDQCNAVLKDHFSRLREEGPDIV